MSFRRETYQGGSLFKESRKKGDVWCFRWRETGIDGQTVQRKRIVGTTKLLKTLAAAEKAAGALRIDINRESSRSRTVLTVDELAAHYQMKELCEEASGGPIPKAHSTADAYRRYLRKWILPRWGTSKIDRIEPIIVEEWLGRLCKESGVPLANGTKVKIRNIMSSLFTHAQRNGILPRDERYNPMLFVRQRATSDAVHAILTPQQLGAWIGALQGHVQVMVLLDSLTGLRRSELLALRWEDVDFLRGEIQVRRAVVNGILGLTKNIASRKPVAMHDLLATALREYRQSTAYSQPGDWLIASHRKKGLTPLTPGALTKNHLKPAAMRAGITESVAFHTMRRTCASLLVANGEDIKVIQESMRHASSRTTLDTYAQSNMQKKQAAQGRLLNQIIPVNAETGLSNVMTQ